MNMIAVQSTGPRRLGILAVTHGRKGVRVGGRALLLVGTVLVAALFAPGSAAAYSPSGAISWAESHAIPGSENCSLSVCLSNDCTAFISQVLWWGGGYTQTTPKTTNTHDHHFWWLRNIGAGFGFTDSWGYAQAQYDFQILHSPGGTLLEIRNGTEHTVESGIANGSLLFYDWEGDGHIDHVSIQVGRGTDPTSGMYGDYVDQHSTDTQYGVHFKHGFWSDLPYNPNNAYRTKIYAVRIYNSN